MHRSLSGYEDCPARPVVSATARSRTPRGRPALRCSCAASPTTGGTSGGLARVTTSPSARPNTRSRYLGPGHPSGDQAVVRATSRDVAALQFNAVTPATGGRDPSRPGPPARSCRRPTNRGLAHRWRPIPMRCPACRALQGTRRRLPDACAHETGSLLECGHAQLGMALFPIAALRERWLRLPVVVEAVS